MIYDLQSTRSIIIRTFFLYFWQQNKEKIVHIKASSKLYKIVTRI